MGSNAKSGSAAKITLEKFDDLDRTKLVNGRNAVKTSLVLFLFTNSK